MGYEWDKTGLRLGYGWVTAGLQVGYEWALVRQAAEDTRPSPSNRTVACWSVVTGGQPLCSGRQSQVIVVYMHQVTSVLPGDPERTDSRS